MRSQLSKLIKKDKLINRQLESNSLNQPNSNKQSFKISSSSQRLKLQTEIENIVELNRLD